MNVMGIIFANDAALGELTSKRTMASLPFAGRYRHVDFHLSNMAHAGIRHIGVISVGCTIGEDAIVEDSVVMPGVVIESGAIVRHAILGENSRVGKNAVVGGAFKPKEKKKISVTSKGAVVEANTVLLPGEML